MPELPLQIPARVVLVGRALTADTPAVEVAVGAIALAQSSVTGEGTSINGSAVLASGRPRFTFTLAPCWPDLLGTCKDNVYTFRLTPDPTALPPAEFRDVTLRDEATQEERPFALPGPSAPPSLSGDVKLLDGTPLHGLTLYGVDEAGQRATTEALTDLGGDFSVRYWSHYAGHRIQLLATSKDTNRPLPRIVQSLTLPQAGTRPLPIHVIVPDIGSTFTAQGRVLDLGGTPVVGAQLHFGTALAAGPFEASSLAGADGRFSVTLYPGDYTVDVSPSIGTGLRLLRTHVVAEATGAPIEIHLKSLVPVTGRVTWPDGTPLAQTQVAAQLEVEAAGRPELTDPTVQPPTRVVEGETDARGVFTLLLDTGRQRLTISPIEGLGLPAFTHRFEVPIEAGLAVDLGDVPVQPAGVIALTVDDIRELPVIGATVQVWRTDLTDGPAKVAESTTDGAGHVVLRVPAESAEVDATVP